MTNHNIEDLYYYIRILVLRGIYFITFKYIKKWNAQK